MKKSTILAVCALLLFGGVAHLLLANPTNEEQCCPTPQGITLDATPIPVTPFAVATPLQPMMAQPVKPQPVRPLSAPIDSVPVNVVKILDDGRQVVETVMHPRTPVPVPPRPIPDTGKFRLPIEYKLTNIPAASLKEFLEEQFKELNVEVEGDFPKDAKTITITTSLEVHRIIRQTLVEIEREVEALLKDAAGGEQPVQRVMVFDPM